MPNILTEAMVALVSASVSAIDGQTYGVQNAAQSAFLGTMYDFMHKLMNRIHTASTTLVLGGSNGSVAVGTSGMGTLSGVSAIYGQLQGWPFIIVGEPQSGSPASNASPGYSTTSMTIRKVLVCLTGSAMPPGSSFGSGFTVQFVYGSAYAVSYANAVSTGGASNWFNQVPLPKPSAMQVPVGWINVPCSFAASGTISTPQLITDYRETQGWDFSAIQGTVHQP